MIKEDISAGSADTIRTFDGGPTGYGGLGVGVRVGAGIGVAVDVGDNQLLALNILR